MTNLNHLLSKQLDALLTNETNLIANMANTSALINETLPKINWAGFYLYDYSNNSLTLGPFQGKVACMHIKSGDGVCGTAIEQQSVIRVKNVHEFPGHIACDAASNSEIVVPLIKNERLLGVLDIDSPIIDRFSLEDEDLIVELANVFLNHVDNSAENL